MQSESEEPGHCAGFSFFCEQHKAPEKIFTAARSTNFKFCQFPPINQMTTHFPALYCCLHNASPDVWI